LMGNLIFFVLFFQTGTYQFAGRTDVIIPS